VDLVEYLMDKQADVTGTNLMPVGAPTYTDKDRSLTKTIPKVGAALETTEGQSGKQLEQLPQAKPFRLRVDTTDKEAPTVASTKQAQHYALPSFGRYPLDSYGHVKQAAAYFTDNYKFMVPEIRREYCQNLTKRASELGIEVTPEIRKYGSSSYAPAPEVEAALSGRTGVIKTAMHLDGLERLRQVRALMAPDDFAVALGEFDKVAGLVELYDRDILDPYYSTFGEKRAEAEDEAFLIGNDYISAADLKTFAKTCSGKLMDMFGKDFVEEFRKDPAGILRSMPSDQKKIIIRLASSSLTDPTTT
jgi:hypothetical protein